VPKQALHINLLKFTLSYSDPGARRQKGDQQEARTYDSVSDILFSLPLLKKPCRVAQFRKLKDDYLFVPETRE
jgi:hypothetical protein